MAGPNITVWGDDDLTPQRDGLLAGELLQYRVWDSVASAEYGIESRHVLKMYEGRPNIVDELKNGEIQLIVNTPAGKLSVTDDSYIRKSAIKDRIPYITTIPAAAAAAEGIAARQRGEAHVRSLQEYHANIK